MKFFSNKNTKFTHVKQLNLEKLKSAKSYFEGCYTWSLGNVQWQCVADIDNSAGKKFV